MFSLLISPLIWRQRNENGRGVENRAVLWTCLSEPAVLWNTPTQPALKICTTAAVLTEQERDRFICLSLDLCLFVRSWSSFFPFWTNVFLLLFATLPEMRTLKMNNPYSNGVVKSEKKTPNVLQDIFDLVLFPITCPVMFREKQYEIFHCWFAAQMGSKVSVLSGGKEQTAFVSAFTIKWGVRFDTSSQVDFIFVFCPFVRFGQKLSCQWHF